MPLTLEQAREASKRAEGVRERREYYGLKSPQSKPSQTTPTPSTPSLPVTDLEPADPYEINHGTRLKTRLAPQSWNPCDLPKMYVECGCGECPPTVDPLYDGDDGPFSDITRRQWAAEECPNPRPVTVERARKIYYVYQKSSFESADRSSRYETIKAQHGEKMDAERELLNEWKGDVTTAFLSLRVRPVEPVPVDVDGKRKGGESENADYYGLKSPKSSQSTDVPFQTDTADPHYGVNEEKRRRWIPPLELDSRIHSGWELVRKTLGRHLDDYEYGYLWAIGTTDSAATPHLHIVVWVKDPENDVTLDDIRPAVDSFTNNVPNAHEEDHPIEVGESDAIVIDHDPELVHPEDDDTIIHITHESRTDYTGNTKALKYILDQRPHWVLEDVIDDDATSDDIALEGAAISRASSTFDWINDGGAFGE